MVGVGEELAGVLKLGALCKINMMKGVVLLMGLGFINEHFEGKGNGYSHVRLRCKFVVAVLCSNGFVACFRWSHGPPLNVTWKGADTATVRALESFQSLLK